MSICFLEGAHVSACMYRLLVSLSLSFPTFFLTRYSHVNAGAAVLYSHVFYDQNGVSWYISSAV